MSSSIWRITSALRGLRGLTSIAGPSFLLAVQVALSVGFASGQISSSEILDTNSRTQPYVSVNQLRTPYKAQEATERAREDFLRGHLDSALRETEHALDIFPQCAVALSIQGAVYMSQTNYADASQRFQQAIQAEPSFGPGYLGLGMVYTSQGRFKEALIPLDRAASFLPGTWIVYFESAVAHLGLGEPETALKEISYAERFTGTDALKRAGVSYLRGMAQVELKHYSEAVGKFKETVERDRKGGFATLASKKIKQLDSVPDDRQIARSSVHDPF